MPELIAEQQPTQTIQEPVIQAPPPKWKPKKLLVLGGISILILIIITAVSYFFVLGRSQKHTSPPKKAPRVAQNNPYLRINKKEIPGVLTSSPSHFEDITYRDLPNIQDLRAIYPYKGNLLLVGISNILEVNPKTNTIIRAMDNRLFDCYNYSAKIDDDLYLACNGRTVITQKGIYKMNLTSGAITKEYLPKDTLNFDNIDIVNQGNILWGGFNNGVLKLDTSDDKASFFSATSFSFGEDCPWYNIGANDEFVWVTPQSSLCSGVALYNAQSETWDTYPGDTFDKLHTSLINSMFTFAYSPTKFYLAGNGGIGNIGEILFTYNAQQKKWERVAIESDSEKVKQQYPEGSDKAIAKYYRDTYFPDALLSMNTPGSSDTEFNYLDPVSKKMTDYEWKTLFYGLSNKVGNEYYIVGNNGIYTLTQNKLPTLFFETSLLESASIDSSVYVDPTATYLVLISPKRGVGLADIVSQNLMIELIDLKKKQVYDLLERTGYANKPLTPQIATIANASYSYVYEPTTDGVLLKDKQTGDELLRITFSDASLRFGP